MHRTVRYALALVALSMLPLAGPLKPVSAATAVKAQPLPIQTVTFNTWSLPALVDVTPAESGLVYDVFMADGACTQSSMKSGATRLAFAVSQYTQEVDKYGTYCFYVDAWTPDGNYLTATILTTVKIVQIAAPTDTTATNTATTATQIATAVSVHN